jgi:ATP-dependent helicase HrpA
VPEPLVRFDVRAVPPHLWPELSVVRGEHEIARGTVMVQLRLQCAEAAEAALRELAGARYPAGWRRFEVETLAESETFALPQGELRLFPALAPVDGSIGVRLHYTAAEAAHGSSQGAVALARAMLAPLERDLRRRIADDAQLLLGASPFMTGGALGELLLDLCCRDACFADAPAPASRTAFEAAVDRGRALLHEALEGRIAAAHEWFAEARAVRQLLDEPRISAAGDAAAETRAHLGRLLDPATLAGCGAEWLRRLPRYLKAEASRWRRRAGRGLEPAAILRELLEWSARVAALGARVRAERRWHAQLEALGWWVEEYRLSLYAQELKTLGPVSPVRLAERAAEVEAWLER